MRYEITYIDGTTDTIDADDHIVIGDDWHFSMGTVTKLVASRSWVRSFKPMPDITKARPA
jgi:hypothetical protein